MGEEEIMAFLITLVVAYYLLFSRDRRLETLQSIDRTLKEIKEALNNGADGRNV